MDRHIDPTDDVLCGYGNGVGVVVDMVGKF